MKDGDRECEVCCDEYQRECNRIRAAEPECRHERAHGELDQGCHPDKGCVRVFGTKSVDIDSFECFGCALWKSDSRRRDGVTRGGHSRSICRGVVAAPLKLVNDFNLYGVLGAGV